MHRYRDKKKYFLFLFLTLFFLSSINSQLFIEKKQSLYNLKSIEVLGLDENLKNEGDDETKEMEMEEGIGQSKRKEEEKHIQNLLADTDHLIGKNKNHEADNDDLNEVQPIMNEKNVHNRPNDVVFCAPNSIWGFTPSAWRSIFTFVMPLLHVLFTTYVYSFVSRQLSHFFFYYCI